MEIRFPQKNDLKIINLKNRNLFQQKKHTKQKTVQTKKIASKLFYFLFFIFFSLHCKTLKTQNTIAHSFNIPHPPVNCYALHASWVKIHFLVLAKPWTEFGAR